MGKRARLVDDEGANAGERLQRPPPFDQDPDLGRPRDARDDGDRHRQDQRARRGDHENGQGPDRIAAPEPCATGEGDRQGQEGHGEPVREPRRRSLLR